MNILKGAALIVAGIISVPASENDITFFVFALIIGIAVIREGIKEVREDYYDEQRKNHGYVR